MITLDYTDKSDLSSHENGWILRLDSRNYLDLFSTWMSMVCIPISQPVSIISPTGEQRDTSRSKHAPDIMTCSHTYASCQKRVHSYAQLQHSIVATQSPLVRFSGNTYSPADICACKVSLNALCD